MNIPPELLVFAVSMIPISEMAGAIPLGISLGLSSTAALFWAIIGNTFLSIILLKILDKLVQFLAHQFPKLHHKVDQHLKKIHHKHSKAAESIGLILLPILIILPIPGTGTYSMVLLAYLVKLPFWPSIIAIFIGNIFLGAIITGLTQGALVYFK